MTPWQDMPHWHSKPIVDTTVEARRVDRPEPMEFPEPAYVWWIKFAANVAAGVAICALIWVWRFGV